MNTSAATPFVYERIATLLEEQIHNGTFQIGDRMPSVRTLCQQEQISPSSAMQALAILEAKGLVQVKPRSGYYVRARRHDVARLPDTAEIKMEPTFIGVSDDVAAILREAGTAGIIPLGAALPAPELLPVDKLARCVVKAARDHSNDMGKYQFNEGIKDFIRQLALHFASFGCPIPPAEITITSGVTEALNLAVRAIAKHGQIIAVESPSYFGILEVLESLGVKALPIPSSCEEGIDLQALEQAFENYPVKGLVINSNFSNPTGSCLSQDKRKALLDLASDFGVTIIEDDIYGDHHFGEIRPKPIKTYDSNREVIYCGSFSKTISPDFRVGWIAAGKYTERVRRLKYITSISTPSVLQYALADFLKTGGLAKHLRKLRSAFQTQTDQMSDAIIEHFPKNIGLSRPEGAFFLWVELPDNVDAYQLHALAIKDGISIAPGPLFCPHGRYRNAIRLCSGAPWTPTLENAIKTLGQHVRTLGSPQLK